MSETGAIKFTCDHVNVQLAAFDAFEQLNACRRELLEMGLIGADAAGIGYGNLSVRERGTRSFYITGSATAAKEDLTLDDYARVTAFDAERNWLRCEGRTVASSESLTHAAVYEADQTVDAVIHGHNATLWRRLINRMPTTRDSVEYGTPAMASEVTLLFRETDVAEQKLFMMGGHEDGFIAFGASLAETMRVLRTSAGVAA